MDTQAPGNTDTQPRTNVATLRGRFSARGYSCRDTSVERLSADVPATIAHYIDTWKGVTETPGLPALLAPPVTMSKRRALVIKLARLAQQPSSWRGAAMVAAAMGATISPEWAAHIMAVGMAVAGLIGMLVDDGTAPAE